MIPVLALSALLCAASAPAGTTGSAGADLAASRRGASLETPDHAAADVLVVVWDDVGWDAIRDAHTPTFDALRARGTTLERFYVNPSCSPTRVALFTGQYSFRNGVGRAIRTSRPTDYFPAPPRLSLADLGPAALVGKWHLGLEDPGSALDWRFTRWRAGVYGNIQAPEDFYDWTRLDDGVTSRSLTYSTVAQVDEALALWDRLPRPRTLVVSFNDAHGPPHDPPGSLLSVPVPGFTRRARFLRMVQALDAETGRLVRGLAPDLVWVFSDNGSARGVGDVPQPDGGKGSVFESGVRVPCVLSGLDVPAGVRMRELAHVVDVLPTLAALRGVSLPGPVDGVSLWGAVRTGRTARTHAYTQSFEPNGFGPRVEEKEAVAERRYKMTRVDGVERLYHLGQDPDERSPLDPTTVPDVAARLRALLDHYGE